MKVTVRTGQTLADIAIQEYGSLEAVFLLAWENGISPTVELSGGAGLERPDATFDREMERYCRDNRVSPATARTETDVTDTGIFTDTFTLQFM